MSWFGSWFDGWFGTWIGDDAATAAVNPLPIDIRPLVTTYALTAPADVALIGRPTTFTLRSVEARDGAAI